MKYILILLFSFHFFSFDAQLFDQIFPQTQYQPPPNLDRFEQINGEPPNPSPIIPPYLANVSPLQHHQQPSIKDLLSQVQNIVNSKPQDTYNVLEPPRNGISEILNPPNFLAKNPDNKLIYQENQDNHQQNNKLNKNPVNEENLPSASNDKEVVIDGEKYEINEIREIILFNKKLIKLCKIDFSNCFDIKDSSILPRRKTLNSLVHIGNYLNDNENLKKNRQNDENENIDFNYSDEYKIPTNNDIDEKIEDDLIDLGLK